MTKLVEEEKHPTVLLSLLDNYGGDPFDELFDVVLPVYGLKDAQAALDITPNVVLVVWGGADISPTIYHQVPNWHTGATEQLSDRDVIEVKLVEWAMKNSVPMIGVCRGAQLMCALSGGTLIQHVNGHTNGFHTMVVDDGREFNVPSLHHQMMNPWSMSPAPKFKIIGWSKPALSDVYLGEPDETSTVVGRVSKKVEMPMEPEIIWFPDTKALCIQSHPEFIHNAKHPFRIYCNELVQKYCLNIEESK